MDRRIRIAIDFEYYRNWTGGNYYFLNLIRALNLLSDENKPELIVCSNEDILFSEINNIGYPYLETIILKDYYNNLIVRVINKFLRKIDLKKYGIYPKVRADVLFTKNTEYKNKWRKIDSILYWIPDFQELYYPDFFTEQELAYRRFSLEKLITGKANILLSSYSSEADLKKIYPHYNKVFVLNFAVTSEQNTSSNFKLLKEKYNINFKYFICPNQFWIHKNHITLIKAVEYLLKKGSSKIHVLFTGKEADYRNPNYIYELKEYVNVNNLDKHIHFLGFIPKIDLNALMMNAVAVIQPSLFEGWSTVIEDAKALKINVIASNLDVHIEQIGSKGFFFHKTDYKALSELILMFLSNKVDNKYELDYNKNKIDFAQGFVKIVMKLVT